MASECHPAGPEIRIANMAVLRPLLPNMTRSVLAYTGPSSGFLEFVSTPSSALIARYAALRPHILSTTCTTGDQSR